VSGDGCRPVNPYETANKNPRLPKQIKLQQCDDLASRMAARAPPSAGRRAPASPMQMAGQPTRQELAAG